MMKRYKASLFVIVFFFLSNFLFAQSRVTINDNIISLDKQAISYRDKNEFSLSEKVFLEVLKLKEINIGTNTSSYSNTILNFALLKEKENDLTKADSLFKIAVDINDKINSKDFIALFLQAKFYSKIRLYELAEMNFLKILLKTDRQDELYLKSMLELYRK